MVVTRLDAVEVDRSVADGGHGRVSASGSGWMWVRTTHGSVHVCGPGGPRGPRTAVVALVPDLEHGAAVDLETTAARITSIAPLPPPVSADSVALACDRVRPFVWDDPAAGLLASEPLGLVIHRLIGRGPGLTPAGDDAICGFLAARFAVDPDGAVRDGKLVLANLDRTGEPSASLLRAAATEGRTYEAGMALLAGLLSGGEFVGPSLRRLLGLGHSTGRALVAGLVGGLCSIPR